LAGPSPRLARAELAAGNAVLANDTKEKESHDMYKIAAIIGGVLLLAGVALAGTVTSLGTTTSPSISSLPAAATTATTAPTAEQEDRGRQREARGRANEPGEDLRGPCDEAEHANDPRCAAGAGTATVTTRVDDDRRGRNSGHDDRDDRGDDHGGNSGHSGGNSGPGGGGESGHGGDD
jgi:hypothetical protein